MRARIALIIDEDLLAKVDAIAVVKIKRSSVIVQAITEFIAREEAKAPKVLVAEVDAK